jgi:heme a synthase
MPKPTFAPGSSTALRRFSKLTCFSTLILIFVGGLVKSTESGLAVPDWPLSYGTLFPPMVGGVLYEHGHRMAATLVGFFILILSIWLGIREKRRWVKVLGFCSLGAVIAQGILGGLTVLFFLPAPISVAHGTLAQTFFLMTIILAYAQSAERARRSDYPVDPVFIKSCLLLLFFIYIQLILGAVMRHIEAGLAIGDFPTMGGRWVPEFDDQMLAGINAWRFHVDLEPVTMTQVLAHFAHRLWAAVLTITLIVVNYRGLKYVKAPAVCQALLWLDIAFISQIALGALTVLTMKEVILTTLHVTNGAAVLGLTMFLILRSAPLRWQDFRKQLS